MITLDTMASHASIGLRNPHITDILTNNIQLPWLELLLDNWLADGGLTTHYLDALCERYPISLHGVGLSLGGMEALDRTYLTQVKHLMQRTEAMCYSEHLCFSQLQSYHSHDLLPLPYTEEALDHVAQRIIQVQDFLGYQLMVENVSSYVHYHESCLSEGEFIAALSEKADCILLLDVNNFYVNQINHQHDAKTAIQSLPVERIKEIHLAGFADQGNYLIDAHNNPVADAVWDLYQWVLNHCGHTATLIEWDNDIPSLEVLLAERDKAQCYIDQSLATDTAVSARVAV